MKFLTSLSSGKYPFLKKSNSKNVIQKSTRPIFLKTCFLKGEFTNFDNVSYQMGNFYKKIKKKIIPSWRKKLKYP